MHVVLGNVDACPKRAEIGYFKQLSPFGEIGAHAILDARRQHYARYRARDFEICGLLLELLGLRRKPLSLLQSGSVIFVVHRGKRHAVGRDNELSLRLGKV